MTLIILLTFYFLLLVLGKLLYNKQQQATDDITAYYLGHAPPSQLTEIFLEGDAVDIEIEDKNCGSALRALRKLSINYEIIE